MNLLKTSFLSGISTFIKIGSAFIANKLVAVYVGPAGLAMIGQFQNVMHIFLTFSNGAIDRGVVKYVAEHHDDTKERAKVISNSFFISTACALIMSVIVAFLHKDLAVSLLRDEKYSSIFLVFACTMILFSLNTLFLSILNGFKEIKKFIFLNIVHSLITLVFVSVLVVFFKLYGALLALAINQGIVFFFTLYFVITSNWFNIEDFKEKIDPACMRKLGKFSLMALTTTIVAPVAQILVRNYITDSISLDAAGFWQGVCKISDLYLLVITTALSVYYIPKLSEIKDGGELRKEILNSYRIVIPIVSLLAFGIFIFKTSIINILFTEEFLPMKSLFLYQLIGDVFKIAAWLLGFIMIAKAMTKKYIFYEIIGGILYVSLSVFFINHLGLLGSTVSFAVMNLIAFIALVIIFRKYAFFY